VSEPTWQPSSGDYPPPPPQYAPPPDYAPPPPVYPPTPVYPAVGAIPGFAVQTRGNSNGLAIASLVCGIVGLCTGIGGILAVVFGHIALSQINSSGGTMGGKGQAIVGLVLGYIEVVVVVLYIIGAVASAAR
jgi:hypothetical protein